jgi:NAD(P)-dependent dehydrogenase (short-subunit alcohol dehydrogenase family)
MSHRLTGRNIVISGGATGAGAASTPHGLRELKELRALGVDVSEADISRLQGRICEPEEVAAAALFLMSDDASFVNGETLFVDNAMLVGT